MAVRNISITITLVLITLSLVLCVAEAAEEVVCFPCREGECDKPLDCLYGETRDPCGKPVCAAGPGERCGGRDNHLGKCGDGMSCKCGKCTGCSVKRIMEGVIECQSGNPICT